VVEEIRARVFVGVRFYGNRGRGGVNDGHAETRSERKVVDKVPSLAAKIRAGD
jgi:hypothetical protein